MFLDDELLEIAKKAECTTSDQVQELNITLSRKCEDYYKSKLSDNMTKKEVKALLDKTFNLFDSFVRSLLSNDDEKLQILGKLFKKFSFRNQFLSNKEMNEIYDSL